jgi:CheY-like chemotaxis protein
VRGRLLLVDDEVHVRTMLQVYLENHGYIVETAVNGRDALTKMNETDYDLVVTDYNMPEVDHDRCRKLLGRCPDIQGNGGTGLPLETL